MEKVAETESYHDEILVAATMMEDNAKSVEGTAMAEEKN